nr:unnamed protein product [Spirometra erinaceieuropaei]
MSFSAILSDIQIAHHTLNFNNVFCHIYNQSEENIFQINPADCLLKLKPGASLDYETLKNYFVCVSVVADSESRRPPSLLQFQINVLEVNDEPPSFKPPWGSYPNAQAEAVLVGGISTPPGTRVFRAEATDPDANADLVYSWSPGREVDTQGRFYISPTSVRNYYLPCSESM